MAKKVRRQEQADVEVEVVGVVKHDGDYVEPGTRIMLTDEQAKRLTASGHVRRIQNSKVKTQKSSATADKTQNGANGSTPLDEGAGEPKTAMQNSKGKMQNGANGSTPLDEGAGDG